MGARFVSRNAAFLPVRARSFAALAAAQDDVKLVFSKFHRQIPSIKGVLAFMSRQGMPEFSRKTFV